MQLVEDPHALSFLHVVDVAADCGNVSGELDPERPRELERPAREVLPQVDVEVVERARAHAHEHLVVGRDGVGDLVEPEHVPAAVLVEANGPHRPKPMARSRIAWR